MRLAPIFAALIAASMLSGCAVVEVGGAVIGAGATVVGTTVDVAGDVISTAADVATGSGKKKSDDNSGN